MVVALVDKKKVAEVELEVIVILGMDLLHEEEVL